MGRVCSTGDFSGRDKLEYWQGSLQQVCGDFTTHAACNMGFEGYIGLASIGGLEIARISSNAEKISRSRAQVSGSDDEYCFLITQVSGRSRMIQNGKEAVLKPGSLTLIDSGRPSEFSFDGAFTQLSVHLPRATLENCLRRRNFDFASAISGNDGAGAVAADMIRSMYRRSDELPDTRAEGVRDGFLSIIRATLDHDADMGLDPLLSPNKISQVRHLQQFVQARLPDPELSPAKIAGDYGISARHLHRIFQWAGVSFGEWVKNCRLEKCRDDLADPKFAGHGIIQIAFHWGFNDASHFSRAFKSRYKVSPRKFRTEEARRRISG